jgi:HK97 family phage prohead protease
MCLLLGVPVQLVDVTGDATALGRVHHELGTTVTDDEHATRMKIILGGLIESAESIADLPAWPLNSNHGTTDQRQLALLAKALGLDRAGYSGIVDEALELWQSPEYKRLHAVISHTLEQHGQLDRDALLRVKAIAQEASMEHKRFSVIDTEIDEGEMLALASTWEVDRVKDRVIPGAYREAVAKIKSGDYLPLIWQHSIDSPLNYVGEVVDADETYEGLRIRARFDLDDSAGRKAYQLVKRGRIKALSIGYHIVSKRRAAGGVTELVKLDLHEVSLVLAPANEGARVLAVKTDDEPDRDVIELADEYTRRDLEPVRREWADLMTKAMGGQTPAESLRQKSERIAREHAPITVASFEC